MDIAQKASIIEEFVRDHVVHNNVFGSEVDKFIKYNDLGVPLSQATTYSLCTLTEDGEVLVDETWSGLCDLLQIDPEGEYDDLDDCFASIPPEAQF